MPEQTKKWFKPIGSEIQQTVPSFPLDALQVTERLDRIESALVHPFETFQEIHRKLSGIEVLQRELVNDVLVKRQFRDEPISIGLTINYELKYHRHLYAYLYSNTAFTLLVSNGASLSIPANYWTNVSLPEGVYFSVSGGSDVNLQNATVRTCDVPMNMATQSVSVTGTPNVNIADFGGIATQMGSSSMILANSPAFVPGVWNGSTGEIPWSQVSGDGLNNTTSGIGAITPYLWNGSSLDKQRANTDNVQYMNQNAVGSGTYVTGVINNYNMRGANIYVNISAIGTGTVTTTIQGFDPATGNAYTILTSTAFNTVSFNPLTVYPGVLVTANVSASTILPRSFKVSTVVAMSVGTVSFTISGSLAN